MIQDGMTASGFPCPTCGQRERAEVLEGIGTSQLELRCVACETVWAAEV